jgi:hypothetical protein
MSESRAQYITIGFSRPKSKLAVLAHLIRLFEGRTPYSHVFISWHSSSLNRTLIYEARGDGVNFTNEHSFNKKNKVVATFELEVSPQEKTEILQFCIDNSRTQYGHLQVLGIGIIKIARKIGCKIKNPFTKGNVCSEIAARIISMLGVSITEDLNLVGPRYIYEVLDGQTKIDPK